MFLIIFDARCISGSARVFKRTLLTHLNRLARGVLEVLLASILVIVFEVGYAPDKERRASGFNGTGAGPADEVIE